MTDSNEPPRNILTYATHIAGIDFHKDARRQLTINDMRAMQHSIIAKLRLEREPDNEHDEHAVAIFDANMEIKLGYIPKHLSARISQLLDESRVIEAKQNGATGIAIRYWALQDGTSGEAPSDVEQT